MAAALQSLRGQQPFETIVAVPVAAEEQIGHVRCWCDEVICCRVVPQIQLVDHLYGEFPEISDTQAIHVLTQANAEQTPIERARSHGPICMPIEQSRSG